MPQGLSLGIRSCGDWSRALNRLVVTQMSAQVATPLKDEGEQYNLQRRNSEESWHEEEVTVRVMIDGPYGGCSIDLGDYQTVILFAGGSGVTFTLGLLDDIVGRCVRQGRRNGEVTRRIEFVWCIRHHGKP